MRRLEGLVSGGVCLAMGIFLGALFYIAMVVMP